MDYFLMGIFSAGLIYLGYTTYVLQEQVKILQKLNTELMLSISRLSRNS